MTQDVYQQLNAANDKISSLKAEKRALQAKLEAKPSYSTELNLKAENTELKKERAQLLAKLSEFPALKTANVLSLETNLKAVRGANVSLCEQVSTMSRRIAELEANQKKDIEPEISALLDYRLACVRALKKRGKKLRAQINAVLNDNDMLSEELATATKRAEVLETLLKESWTS